MTIQTHGETPASLAGTVAGEAGAWISVAGHRLFLREEGSGHPIVLLHGIPTSSFLWRRVLPVVARDYRGLAPDLLGFGRSDKPASGDYTVTGQATLLGRLLEQLGLERYALAGHDFGALVAAELLARRPEQVTHLVILNTSFRPERWSGPSPLWLLRLPLLGELAMALARPWMLRLAMRPFLAEPGRLTRGDLDGYWEPFERSFRTTLLRLYRSAPMTAADFARWRETLGRLAVPCLIAWGARDPAFRADEARELARLIPGARLVLFAHASHFLPEDRPQALGRLIGLFLEHPEAVPQRG
jgi:pimeloyl-ACP methyl ester carboxylesterase